MSANLPSVFNSQFFAPAVDGVAKVAAGYTLQAYLSGTTTPHDTYFDPGGFPDVNTNPIVLDDDGRCTLYLDPDVLYTFVLFDLLGVPVNTWNNVGAAALTTGTVVSINGLTGIVVLDASGIPYTTSSAATWLTADEVESALDQIADRANAPPADSVTVAAISGLAATDVQAALAEIVAKTVGTQLLRITPFLASGTWTKGTDVGSVFVELSGGGGGSNASVVASGGGGGGGSSRMLIAAPGATEAVTVGAGGAIGATGGTSSFGAWCAASGGTAGGVTKGGLGGVGTGGDINLRGKGGGWGAQTGGLSLFGDGGGSALHGGGARGNVGGGSGDGAAQAGDANTGGGASGGTSGGAAGGSGVVYVWEYSK